MKNEGTEAIVVAETDWHHWYECDDDDGQDEHSPHSHRRYQRDECNLDYYSELSEKDMQVLMRQLEHTAGMLAWRLGHFEDRHVPQLEIILDKWLLVEPCHESARLPWQAHLQFVHFGNRDVSRCLLEHMLRQGVSRQDILENVADEDDIQGEENIEPEFVDLLHDCETTVLHERLVGQLSAKSGGEKKVKI